MDDFAELPVVDSTKKELAGEIVKKNDDIQALLERIHQVRFDTSRQPADVSRTVKNLILEVRRLDAELTALRKRQLREVESGLDLGTLGLSATLLSDSRSSLSASRNLDVPASTITSPNDPVLDDTLTEEEMAELKLMRTESTGVLEGQTPKSKWQSLFKMFQEWKRETNIAQGQYALNNATNTHVDEEIVKIRAAIVSLQQKKSLPPSEHQLLAQLQQRLQHLMRVQRTLANV